MSILTFHVCSPGGPGKHDNKKSPKTQRSLNLQTFYQVARGGFEPSTPRV